MHSQSRVAAAYLGPRTLPRTLCLSNPFPNIRMRALHAIWTFLCPPVLYCVIVEAGGRERVKVKVGQQWRWRRAGGAWEKASRIHAPETSYGCPGACARLVEAAVRNDGGRRCWYYTPPIWPSSGHTRVIPGSYHGMNRENHA